MRLIVFLLSAVCAATMTGASLRSRRDAGYLGSRLALDKMLMDVDTDNNSIIIRSELFNNQGQGDTDNNGFISRCEWVNRAVDIYDDSKLAALNYFDIIDTNRDNKLTTSDTDFPSLDADGDREVSISELRQVLQRDYTMAIDSAAYKKLEQLSRVAAPQGGDIKSTLRIDLIKKDVDSNNDGDVTRTELQAHFISSFDKDGSGKLTVEEFEVAVIQADWVALKKVYPQATTPAPPTGGAVSPYPSMLLAGCIFVLKVWT
ncbi:uncharacterized protein LOC124147704 isoform X3 [Haliotis rufescens]|uniref:uncharacterized protein LOC124147704 isoform X3 n=1 Tax=Haliotis rufescens TaxID=6454 RepID=UPI00201F7491|nr:uncharacterized protein LOC124147704 isoform X3 [Haliotis rufescens]